MTSERAASRKQGPEKTVTVKVELTATELAAVSRAAVVVTSTGDWGFVNAADRGHRKLRDAAARHPDLPNSAHGGLR